MLYLCQTIWVCITVLGTIWSPRCHDANGKSSMFFVFDAVSPMETSCFSEGTRSMLCQRSLNLLKLCKMSTLPTQTVICRFYNTTQKTCVLTATCRSCNFSVGLLDMVLQHNQRGSSHSCAGFAIAPRHRWTQCNFHACFATPPRHAKPQVD